MPLRRLVAFPESRRILTLHLVAIFCLSVEYGVTGIMIATLLYKTLGASKTQVLIATSSVPVMSLLAIFWNEIYRRISVGKYLLLLWSVAIVPLGLISLFSTAGPVLVCVLICAFGTGGIQSVYADILRSCYAPVKRGRVFSVLKAIEQFMVMATAISIGIWLDHNHAAYRMYFPLAVVVIGIGFVLLYRITCQQLFRERLLPPVAAGIARSMRGAYRQMFAVFQKDPEFRQYETAFCTYGLGWMICYSLLPFLVTDKLGLKYGQIAFSTQMALQLTTLLMLVPIGMLMDRIGPIRVSCWTFLFLIIYPVGLLFVWNAASLTAFTIVYGIGMAGVNLSWTMGPVTLAKEASQAPQYLAIHATLVSLRALLGQLPAVLWYKHTHQLRPPFVAAALLFLVGSFLMFRLGRKRSVVPQKEPVQPVEVIAAQSD